MEVSGPPTGTNWAQSLWVSGCICYGGAIIVVNFKILDAFHIFDIIGFLLPILSIASYFLCFYIENLPILGIDDLLGIFSMTMSHPLVYFLYIFIIFQVYSLEKILTFISATYTEYTQSQKSREREQKVKYFYESIKSEEETGIAQQV
jgi:hypothetical protein